MQIPAQPTDSAATDAGTTAVPAQPSPYDARGRHADSWTIITWVAVLIALTLVMGWAILKIRRAMLPSKPEGDQTGGGLMEDLRQMRREGKLTQDEFDAAKRKLSDSMRANLLSDKRPATPRGAGPTKTKPASAPPASITPASATPAPTRTSSARSMPADPADPAIRKAPPGFDLTGAPLPPASEG